MGGPALADAPEPGSIEELRHEEARLALDAGQFERARKLYQILLLTDPDDAWAQRESGRAAHAAGQFEIAVDELRRAHELAGDHSDPELHYLLGEALYALSRDDEARVAHARAEQDIGPSPVERLPSLWLARIHARRGELERAEAIYGRLARGAVDDVEVMLMWTEARIFSGDWTGA
jgi:tetratricopeptide (TPR) repeat protein